MRKIVTSHEYPPIPDRAFDWSAHYEGEEEAGGYGYGRTEAEAIQDFKDNHQADHDERLSSRLAKTLIHMASILDSEFEAFITPRMAKAGQAKLIELGYEDATFTDPQNVFMAMLEARR